jgi:hypothetical protein
MARQGSKRRQKHNALALRAIADDVEKSKRVPQSISVGCISA